MTIERWPVDGRDVRIHSLGVSSRLVEALLPKMLTATVRSLIRTGHNVREVWIELKDERELTVVYKDAYNRTLREDVIPVLAIMQASQAGRDAVTRAGLDNDLRASAEAEIARLTRRRLDRL